MLYSLVLGPAERLALIRALLALRDSRRLDALEERMLERLQWVEREPVAAGLHEL
jgi:hypothetical protein